MIVRTRTDCSGNERDQQDRQSECTLHRANAQIHNLILLSG
ncbi:hypothetical protein C7S16_0237 [Burkholderia thailandensis]|uniref:Uncharacterized protein n=1 Tax=Burkholderia thailandensis TaxID=57975 RepID=A0AAW9D3V2_BURTH|nr:hypothetical protein [Burkholderia thailandensis]